MADRLPQELLCAIGCKLDTPGDRIRFRAVSKSWRSALPFRQPPWLLLLKELSEFIITGEQTLCKIDVPEILHQLRFGRVVGCAGNWLLIHQPNPKSLLVLNPFSNLQFHLPPYQFEFEKVRNGKLKVALSSPPRGNGADQSFTAVAYHWDSPKLFILRPGDTSWAPTAADTDLEHVNFDDVVFYKGQFYAYIDVGKLLVCDISEDASKPPRLSLVSDFFADQTSGSRKHYLVEWSGELLMVVRFVNKKKWCYEVWGYNDPGCETNTFEIYKFDFGNMKFDEVKCLGDYSLFLGRNTSMSVPASDYFGLVRRNCIYFSDDWVSVEHKEGFIYERKKTRHDIGVFSLEDNSITPHFKGTSSSVCSGSVWIIPA